MSAFPIDRVNAMKIYSQAYNQRRLDEAERIRRGGDPKKPLSLIQEPRFSCVRCDQKRCRLEELKECEICRDMTKKNTHKLKKKKVYTFGGIEFSSLAKANTCIVEYKKTLRVGDYLDEKHTRIVLDMIKKHPYYDEFKHNVKSSTRIVMNKLIGDYNPHLALVNDGESNVVKISLQNLGQSVENDYRKTVLSIMRNTIRHQCVEFREAVYQQSGGIFTCAVDGKVIHPNDVHVDHSNEHKVFITIAREFVDANFGGIFKQVPIIKNPDKESTYTYVMDECLETQWNDYHKANARLRILCMSCNLSGACR